jgi:hypothetical protein
VEFQDLIAHDQREVGILQPAAAIRRANGEVHDVVLAFEKFVWQVVLFPALHGSIVHA